MKHKQSEHSAALELIGYGLAKFAGTEKGKNVFANSIDKNRNSFFKRLVELGIATSTKAVSVRQDNYDPYFPNGKSGFVRNDIVKRYNQIKPRIDAIVGSLSMDEYIKFVNALIDVECGKSVSEEQQALIDVAKRAVFDTALHVEVKKENSLENEMEISKVEEEKNNAEETSLHTEIEWILIQIGKITGCDVFVARNDRSKCYQGEQLGAYCIDELPTRGLDEQTERIISLIDVVWVKDKKIVCAFEVECTTQVNTGILRISDLAYSDPYNKIKGYIVAPKEREKKVVNELSRPTFSNEHIAGFIKYITIEELKGLYTSLGAIKFKPGVMGVEIVEGYAHSV